MAVLVAVFSLLLPARAMAATPYLEFAPDARQFYDVAASDSIREILLPLNDYFSGFDLWLSDHNTAMTVSFAFLSPTGDSLGGVTATVPAIADTDTGTRFHVDLPAQIAVSPISAYAISISPASVGLRLYDASANVPITYNAPPPPLYSNGKARINGEDQDFSFLYALYESREYSPPVITNLTLRQSIVGFAGFELNANEPVDLRIELAPTGQALATTVPFSNNYQSCAPGVATCNIDFPVTPGTVYDYELDASDIWRNIRSLTGTFTAVGSVNPAATPTPVQTPTATSSVSPTITPSPTPDTSKPVISGLSAVDLRSDSASFAWTTNKATNGLAVVQLRPDLINAGFNNDNTLELVHYVTVSGLTPDTYYRATVTSADALGNSAQTTVDFLTPRQTPTPVPSSLPPASSVTPTPTVVAQNTNIQPNSSTDISWNAPTGDSPSNGFRVDIFSGLNTLVRTITTTTNHVQTGPLPVGNNKIIVYANNKGIFKKVAAPTTVHVQSGSLAEKALGAAPYVLGGITVAVAAVIGIFKWLAWRKAKTSAITPPSSGSAMPPSAGAL